MKIETLLRLRSNLENYKTRRLEDAERAAALANRIEVRILTLRGEPDPRAAYEPCGIGHGRFGISDNCADCDRCHARFDAATLAEVTIRMRFGSFFEEYWCEDCREGYTFFCEFSGRQWTDEVEQVDVEGQTLALPYADCVDVYYWDCDGEWHNEPEPEPEEEEEDDGVASYHASTNSWTRQQWAKIPLAHPRQLFAGIELEVYTPDPRALADAADSAGLLAERDGSLDSVHGVELIAQPLRPDAVSGHWEPVLAFLRGQGAKAHNAGQSYGMHVSLPRRYFGRLHLAKLARFMGTHRALCEAVAQRAECHWATYATAPGWGAFKNLEDGSKYRALNVTPSRVEFRIFRANLKTPRFLKNVEFALAAVEFTRWQTPEACASGALANAFLEWVRNRKKEFPNLAAFIAEKL